MACTLVGCPSAPFDGEFARGVSMAMALEVEGGVLTLRAPEATLRFVR